jgi:RHS repeat-associated protein
MSALARATEINYDTRAANEDCINGGFRTRTKYGYDSAKRMTSETQFGRMMSFQYDKASNRIQTTWPDSNFTNFINYDFDALNREYQVREKGATTGAGVLAVYQYDPLSRRQSLTRGNGAVTNSGYDLASRLLSLSHDVAGSAQDIGITFGYTLASQLQTRSSNNPLYDWLPAVASTAYAPNGLNQYSAVGGVTYGYDTRGNMTSDGTNSYTYDVENRLLTASAPTAVTLSYDPLGRLQQAMVGATPTQYLYDGTKLVAEYDGSGNVLRRYVHGPGTDDPIVWYEGATLATRNYLHADERGSVIATTTDNSGPTTVYTYGPYGEPTVWTGSRFRYTGQTAIPEAHLYYYKSRMYSPTLGRFLQTDPIGTKDDLNLYAYVGDDPLDKSDPSGEFCLAMYNDASDFCVRSLGYEYLNKDPRIASKTNFFAAASIVTNTLASVTQSPFMQKLSQDLENRNIERAGGIISGRIAANGSIAANTAEFVHFEQTNVQSALDSLQAKNPNEYGVTIKEANSALNGVRSNLIVDSNFAAALDVTKKALGRPIDFANQKDREALGNAVAAQAAKNAQFCTGTRLRTC